MRPERWPAAGTRGQTHQDLTRVPKSFFSGVMGSALEVLGIKQHFNSFMPTDKSSRDEGFVSDYLTDAHFSRCRWKLLNYSWRDLSFFFARKLSTSIAVSLWPPCLCLPTRTPTS